MRNEWQYQIRIYLDRELAEVARHSSEHPKLAALVDTLGRHNAIMKCQFDAFADYVAEAEKHGPENYPLYEWTRATIEDPVKKAKHLKAFTLYANGNEVYPKEIADALESDLQPLLRRDLITRVSKHSTNPVENPQPPPRRK
jgi:hypothetical protein